MPRLPSDNQSRELRSKDDLTTMLLAEGNVGELILVEPRLPDKEPSV